MSQGTVARKSTPLDIRRIHPSLLQLTKRCTQCCCVCTSISPVSTLYPRIFRLFPFPFLNIIHLENEPLPRTHVEAAHHFTARFHFQPCTSTELDLAQANESILKRVCTNNTDRCFTHTDTHMHTYTRTLSQPKLKALFAGALEWLTLTV